MVSVTLHLCPVTYQDGMVIVAMGWKPIASRFFEATSAEQIWQAVYAMFVDYSGTHDAKVCVYLDGKKPRGFDAVVKANLYKLECHRSPVWEAVI